MRIRLLLAKTSLAVVRSGVAWPAALVLCAAGAGAWLWGIPGLRADVQRLQGAVRMAQDALDRPVVAPDVPARGEAEERLAQFYDNLGERAYAEQQLKSLFAIAARQNLALSQGVYKTAYDRNGRFHTYQISLPVKGTYAAIRQFSEQVLLTVPFASLDELSFRRDAIGNPALEANIRFTLYLAGAASPKIVIQDMKERGFE